MGKQKRYTNKSKLDIIHKAFHPSSSASVAYAECLDESLVQRWVRNVNELVETVDLKVRCTHKNPP
jgi:hypothetical protein